MGRSGSRRWKTRRGTRTTPRYSPISTPKLDGLPFGVPPGVLGEGEEHRHLDRPAASDDVLHTFGGRIATTGAAFAAACRRAPDRRGRELTDAIARFDHGLEIDGPWDAVAPYEPLRSASPASFRPAPSSLSCNFPVRP